MLYDYDAEEDNELTLREGEVIEQLEQVDPGWWEASSLNGKRGLFPCEFVENPPPPRAMQPSFVLTFT